MAQILKSEMESLLFTTNKKEGLKLRFNPSFLNTFIIIGEYLTSFCTKQMNQLQCR